MYIPVCTECVQNVSQFSIQVSFLELYNEELFDFLSSGEDSGNRLRTLLERQEEPPMVSGTYMCMGMCVCACVCVCVI